MPLKSTIFSEQEIEHALAANGISHIGLSTIIAFLTRVLIVIAVLTFAYLICRYIRILCEKGLRRLKFEETVTLFIASFIQWLLLFLVFVACLPTFGIETTSFAAAIGGISVAVGLAFQGSLSNVASGIMLLIFRPYKAGDLIKVKTYTAKVNSIELFFTVVDTTDNRRLFVPNKMIFNGIIENMTFHGRRRIDLPLHIEYGADLSTTRKALEAAASLLTETDDGVEEYQIYLNNMGDYSVEWIVRAWVKTPNYAKVKEDLIFAVKTELERERIEIAYPRHNIHVLKDSVSDENASAQAVSTVSLAEDILRS